MFYKVENEQLIKAPEKSLKIFIANPTDEQYRFFGYTDNVVEEEIPKEEEGKFVEEYYVHSGDVIKKKYRLIDIPKEPLETE